MNFEVSEKEKKTLFSFQNAYKSYKTFLCSCHKYETWPRLSYMFISEIVFQLCSGQQLSLKKKEGVITQKL